jgi:Cu/Ag efflux protein CusF
VTVVTVWRRRAALAGARRPQQFFLTSLRSYQMKTFKPLLVALAFAASAPFAISAHAQAMDHSKMGGMAASMTEGEVRKIDKEAKKITLKDASLLDKVKAGDKVKFAAEKTDSAIVVTAIEPVK